MFKAALAKQSSGQPPKPAPTTTKPVTQSTIHNAFPARLTQPRKKEEVFQPALNKNPPYRAPMAPPAAVSRKRSLEEREGLAQVLNSSAFQENIPPAFEMEKAPLSNGMAALHEAVYIHEDDFDDDLELGDFDVSDPAIDPALAAAAAAIPSPPRSKSPQQTVDIETDPFPLGITPRFSAPQSTAAPQSSASLPWSSSPVEHHTSTTRARQPQNGPEEPPQSSALSEQPTKRQRRTIPWLKEQIESEQIDREQIEREKDVAMAGRISTAKSKVHSSEKRVKKEKAETKDRRGRTQPWNETPADFRAAQKDMRKRNTQKRTLTTAADEDTMAAKRKEEKEKPAAVTFTEEQRVVMDLVTDKESSVFFTGSAGTGKSVLLRELIVALKKKYRRDGDRVAVTASTGLAACNVGGITIHSFAGIGLGREPVKDLVRKIKRNNKARTRWLRTKFLVIDEVSMVDGDLFDKLEEIARIIRNSGRPFGGIKLVITGDFFQLPPVPDNGKLAKFAFDANTWNTCIPHTIGLTQVFRQKDESFARMLNEMRLGHLSKETIDTFRRLSRPLPTTDGLQATELFSTRYEVDRANSTRMRGLQGTSMTFNAEDSGTVQDKAQRDKLLSNCMAPVSIELKVGAQVMLIKNMDESLVNGSLGMVIGFMNEKTWDTLTEDGEIDALINEPDERIRSLAMGDKQIDTARRWPLVQFVKGDGTTRQLLCQPEVWKIEQPNGEVSAQRSQVPLILAWALSIHKAQGQTLEKVKVDLGKAFEKGQAYVALSRATTKEGLQVLGFNPSKVMAHEKVRRFYEGLYRHSSSTPVPSSKTATVASSSSTLASKSKSTIKNEGKYRNIESGIDDYPIDEEAEALMQEGMF